MGWSRAQAIDQVAKLYIADGLRPPGLSAEQLCRFEHGPDRPGPEYAAMFARAYGACLDQLGLATRCHCGGPEIPTGQDGLRYGHPQHAHTKWAPIRRAEIAPMTTAAGLPAVRESLHLAVFDTPGGSLVVVDLAEAAVEHYALNYSKHPPVVLFDEVHAARGLLVGALSASADDDSGSGMRRAAGWLSGLLGNLAFHLGDHAGARAHLTVAAALGERTGDAKLISWSCGASSMLARASGDHATALDYAERGLAHAVGHLQRAQLLAWAALPSLAALSRPADAEQAMADSARELEADQVGWSPGRFGFDAAEYRLHAAEAQLVLGRYDQAAAYAATSIDACVPETPGWAAAAVVLAQTEAPTDPTAAAQRALDVLDRIPAARLRSTTRDRLTALGQQLHNIDAVHVSDLHERLRTLPLLVDLHGRGVAS
ncbi:MAG: hypothetical protein ACT4NY_27045 [Pseudonocardiales bacterium]